jgi:creatinine amidohydrolase
MMLFDWQNTTFEVKDAKPRIAIIPVGLTEPCGEHLPIGTTTIILNEVSRRIAEKISDIVYLLPTMPFGCSNSHNGKPGTISLEWSTLYNVIRDLTESLLMQGIHRVAVIVGLGGVSASNVIPQENYIVKTAVRQLNYDFPELDAIWIQPFTAATEEISSALDSANQDIHAGELTTSLMLYINPENVNKTSLSHVPDVGKEYLDFVSFEKLCPDGVWGNPSLASSEKGEKVLEAAVLKTVEYIEDSFKRLSDMKNRIK